MAQIYNKVQCIAYEVPVIIMDRNHEVRVAPPGVVANPDPLTGPLTLANDSDTFHRVQRLLKVIATAWAQNRVDHAATTLKIFTIPEFYFRPLADPRALSNDAYNNLKETLQKTLLEQVVNNHKKYNNWLFIFGTTIHYKTEQVKVPDKLLRKQRNAYYNSCFYLHISDDRKRINNDVHKAEAHYGDGLKVEGFGYPASIATNFSNNVIRYQEAKGRPLPRAEIKKHLFYISNVRIALEVCLEHTLTNKKVSVKNADTGAFEFKIDKKIGLLKEHMLAGLFTDREKQVHVHILVSAGRNLNDLAVIAKPPRGLFLRNDGSADFYGTNTKGVQLTSVDTFQKVDYTNINGNVIRGSSGNGNPWDLTYSQTTDLDAISTVDLPANLRVPVPNGLANNDATDWNTQRIHIFTAKNLPN